MITPTRFASLLSQAATRRLNPRYAWLPDSVFRNAVRVLDAGCGPTDAIIARRLFRNGCWYEGISLWEPDANGGETQAFARYHQQDLDRTDLGFLEPASYDYIVCSHTLEHLEDGLTTLRHLFQKLRPGGRLYLEWPSVDSLTFPVRGFGLNFYDDPTHRQTYRLEEVEQVLAEYDCEILFAGKRRNGWRMVLSPFLVLYRSLRLKRLRFYDLWDWTGFAYVIMARRAEAACPPTQSTTAGGCAKRTV